MWFNLDNHSDIGTLPNMDRRADRLSDLLREIQGDPPGQRAAKFQAFADATGNGLIEVFRAMGLARFRRRRPLAGFPLAENRRYHRRAIQRADVCRTALSCFNASLFLWFAVARFVRRRSRWMPIVRS